MRFRRPHRLSTAGGSISAADARSAPDSDPSRRRPVVQPATARAAGLAVRKADTPERGWSRCESTRSRACDHDPHELASDTAVKARTAAMITLKQLVVHAPPQLREALQALTDRQLLTRCAALRPGPLDTPAASAKHTLRSIARRWFTLAEEITTHDRHLTRLTTETSPSLCESFGVGANTAAELLIFCGDNPTRIRSEAAFAKLWARVRSRPPRGGPLAGTACIGVATARPTPPSIEPPSSGCGSTSRPSTTSHAAPLMAGPSARSFDASNASLPVNSTSAL